MSTPCVIGVANLLAVHLLHHHSIEIPVELSSPPESTFLQIVVHGSVVTKWLGIVCINYSLGNFNEIMLAH